MFNASPDGEVSDPTMKIYFDDVTLAYKTLVNSVSRREYDEYISQNQRVANHMKSGNKKEEEEDPEEKAERERRRRERGKKRYEQDYLFVNEEFFSSWQNRTNNFNFSFGSEKGEGPQSIETLFDGRDLYVDIEVSFAEAMQVGGVDKQIQITRDAICQSCQGTRERTGSKSLPCYSCKGEGVKRDAIFNKETRCNTCKGHGSLV